MTNQIEVAKDIAIGLLSSSGILLTLLVILEGVSATKPNSLGVFFDVIWFIASAWVNAFALGFILLDSENGSKLNTSTKRLVQLGILLFIIGLGSIGALVIP